MIVSEIFVIHDYLYVPKLDGTETIHSVNGTPIISNGELSSNGNHSGYIGAFDNTGNWELTMQCKWSNGSCGIWLIKSDETNRDSNDVLLLHSNVYRHSNGSSEGAMLNMNLCSDNVYVPIKLTKNGNELTIEKCNDSKTVTWSLLNTLSTLSIGVDAWGGTSSIKDIVVKPL